MQKYTCKAIVIVSVLMLFLLHSCDNSVKSNFSVGLIADCQYCAVEGKGTRKYSKSTVKLKACVNHFNTMDLEYTMHLGDFIDKDWGSFDSVIPIYNQLKSKKYHVLGNHDFSVEDSKKKLVSKRMGLPSDYYDFKVHGWRFIALNCNDVSFHAHSKGSDAYKFAESYYEEHKISSPKWNGALGSDQLDWLKETLEKAEKAKEKVVLYCHFPVYPENAHNLWNAKEVVDLLEKYTCVKAYINGHNHKGNYAKKKGIHYITMKGMVDTEESSFGVLSITSDSLFVKGFGRETDRRLLLKE